MNQSPLLSQGAAAPFHERNSPAQRTADFGAARRRSTQSEGRFHPSAPQRNPTKEPAAGLRSSSIALAAVELAAGQCEPARRPPPASVTAKPRPPTQKSRRRARARSASQPAPRSLRILERCCFPPRASPWTGCPGRPAPWTTISLHKCSALDNVCGACCRGRRSF